MEELDPFEEITDDWYFCSILDKEVRFISHVLRGVTYYIRLETKKGDQYDVPIKKPDIVQYLSKFKLIEEPKKVMGHKDIIEDFTDKEDFEDDEEKDEPVYLEEKKKNRIQTTPAVVEEKKEINIITVMPSLRDELFDLIKLVKAGKIDNSKAREIANISQVIINAAKFELDCFKMFPDEKKKLLK